jgi:hypothetical protein
LFKNSKYENCISAKFCHAIQIKHLSPNGSDFNNRMPVPAV